MRIWRGWRTGKKEPLTVWNGSGDMPRTPTAETGEPDEYYPSAGTGSVRKNPVD